MEKINLMQLQHIKNIIELRLVQSAASSSEFIQQSIEKLLNIWVLLEVDIEY